MTLEHIRYEKRDRLAAIAIDRPEAMEALNRQANLELREVFEDFRDDPDLFVAIVTGAGDRAFCVGADLKELAQQSKDGTRPTGDLPFGTITKQFDCPKPIIAAINGMAV